MVPVSPTAPTLLTVQYVLQGEFLKQLQRNISGSVNKFLGYHFFKRILYSLTIERGQGVMELPHLRHVLSLCNDKEGILLVS